MEMEKKEKEIINTFWKKNPNKQIYTYLDHHERFEDLLKIDSKNLNYIKEMQKLFDNQNFSITQTMNPGWSKKQMNMHREYMKKFRPKKKYYLVYNNDIKIKLKDKLSMKETRRDITQKSKYFIFHATGKLGNLAETYKQVKNTMDINSTVDFLHSNPYFPEALYDLGEYQRLKGNFKEANLQLEKMLFLYEDSLEFAFRIFESNIEITKTKGKFILYIFIIILFHINILETIPFEVESTHSELNAYLRHYLDWNVNKWTDLFFKLIFKFVIILIKKSCFKSALGFSKLLLKLNPVQDPMGALIMMDHAAIGAGKHAFLEEFVLTFGHRYFLENNCSILLYPNYLFSLALSRFKMTQDKKSKSKKIILLKNS